MPGPTVAKCADQQAIPCPVCDGRISRVTDSRYHQGYKFRVRSCRCGAKYTTVEQAIDCSIYDVIVRGETWKPLTDE